MKTIWYCIVIIVLVSCKTNSVAQGKETSIKPIIEKPKFSDLEQQQIAPNTIEMQVSVLETIPDISICEQGYTIGTKVTVERVTNSGAGIINMISAGQVVTLGFGNMLPKHIERIQQVFVKNKRLLIVVRESPCLDFSKTVYEVVRY